jgi:hypothetical protein
LAVIRPPYRTRRPGRARRRAGIRRPAALPVQRHGPPHSRSRRRRRRGGGWGGTRGGRSGGGGLAGSRRRGRGRTTRSTADAGRRDGDIVVPEGIRIATIRFPTEIHARDGGDLAARGPAGVEGVRGGEARDGDAVEPGADAAVGAQVVLEALPGAGGERHGGGHAVGGEVRERGIVGLAVVHQDRVLPADAEVLVGALGGVRHDDEGDVVGGEGGGGFPGEMLETALNANCARKLTARPGRRHLP